MGFSKTFWALCFLILASCQEKSNQSASQFSLPVDRWSKGQLQSFYSQLSSATSVPVCVGFVGHSLDSEVTKSYVHLVEMSWNTWLGAVRKSPSWKGKTVPSIIMRPQLGPCVIQDSFEAKQFSVTFFATQAAFVNTLCKGDSAASGLFGNTTLPKVSESEYLCGLKVGHSFTFNGIPATYISPLIGFSLRHPKMHQSLMHELGHTLGLFDTYKGLGVRYEGTQPPSIMNYRAGPAPSNDDLMGLDTAIAIASGNSPQCQGQVQAGNPDFFYCKPSNASLAAIREAHNRAENTGSTAPTGQTVPENPTGSTEPSSKTKPTTSQSQNTNTNTDSSSSTIANTIYCNRSQLEKCMVQYSGGWACLGLSRVQAECSAQKRSGDTAVDVERSRSCVLGKSLAAEKFDCVRFQ